MAAKTPAEIGLLGEAIEAHAQAMVANLMAGGSIIGVMPATAIEVATLVVCLKEHGFHRLDDDPVSLNLGTGGYDVPQQQELIAKAQLLTGCLTKDFDRSEIAPRTRRELVTLWHALQRVGAIPNPGGE